MARVVLITGAAGGIGRVLVPRLRADDWRVRCLVHRRPIGEADEVVTGDLADVDSLARAVDGADAVLHLAARTHARRPADYAEANVAGTRRLIDAARAAGVARFVHVSTRAIDPSGGAYSRSKLEAEACVRGSDITWTIVRLPEVYGGAGTEGVDDIIDRARRGAVIPVVGRGNDVVCPVHVDDAVDALAGALSTPAAEGKVYTLAGECLSVRQFARTCIAMCEGRGRIVGVPTPALRGLMLAAQFLPLPFYPDQLARLRAPKPPPSPEAATDLGFAPRPLREGLGVSGS